MSKKLIAVTCEIEYESHVEKARHVVNHHYTDYVKFGGGIPIIIPLGADPKHCAETFDGLLLTGGKDITPTVYGRDNYAANKCSIARDRHELSLLRAFHKANKPIFGICRGFQLIGIFYKMPLHQHVENDSDVHLRHNQRACEIPGINPVHKIELQQAVSEVIGKKLISVNSFHHQGFIWTKSQKIMQELQVDGVGLSRDKDAIIEALLLEHGRVGGVQYHPERMVTDEKSLHLKLFRHVMGIAEE
jgi:putative glutamine amidotransferase